MFKKSYIFKLKKILAILVIFQFWFTGLPLEIFAQEELGPTPSESLDSPQDASIPSDFGDIGGENPTATSAAALSEEITFDTQNSENVAESSALLRQQIVVRGLSKSTYKADEAITITLDNTQETSTSLKLFNPDGEEVAVNTEVVSDVDPTVIKILPPSQFQAGRYRLKIEDPEGGITTREFTWGVLAINTNKSIYTPDEDAFIAMAVLDEVGEMVCNADLTLDITNRAGEVKTFTSESGTIIVNPQCYTKDFTLVPDYQATYKVGGAGAYAIRLTASTDEGTYSIRDSFEVRENVAFDVERKTVTRFFPPHTYPVTFKIKANQDFNGTVSEIVPASFAISQDSESQNFDSIELKAESTEESVLGAQIFDIGKPYKGDYEETLGFGKQHKDPLLGQKYTEFGVLGHDGVDFALPMDTSVIAVDDGEIARAGDGDYGVTIVIQHDWGRSYYGHLDKVIASEGTKVEKGQTIALSGNTGLSSGPHLHFGIKPTKNDPENGYYGKINPLPFLGLKDNGVEHGQVAGTSTEGESLPTGTQVISWKVSVKAGDEITLGYRFDAPQVSPELYLLGPLEMEENGNVVFSEVRRWQLAADSVVVSGGIVSSDAQFGGLQRKVAFVNSNWYAFYNDDAGPGVDVFWKKSSDGVTWGSAQNLDVNEDNDADNYNPSISANGATSNFIHIFWLDESADAVQGLTLDTTSDTTPQTSVCGLTSPGAFTVSSYMVSVASTSSTNAVVAYSDTSSGTNVDIFEVNSLTSATCTSTDVHPGNIEFGSQGSGLTASDRPVLAATYSDNTVVMVYQDGSNLLSALYNTTLDEWTRNNTLVANVADTTYSVATDNTNVWLLSQNGTTATRLYSYPTVDFAETQFDAGASSTNGDDDESDIDMFCPASDNCKIVYTDDIDTSAPKLIFADCNDEACSSPVLTQLDGDIGAADDQAGASIYCVASDNCKVAYGDDMGTASPALVVRDCTADEDCSTNSVSAEIDTDLGTSASILHTDIDCVGGDTDCKVIYNDTGVADVFFVDCADANCDTGETVTQVDSAAGTRPFLKLSCVTATNCKWVYMDAGTSPYDMIFVDCPDATCSGTAGTCNSGSRTCTNVDTDVGTSGGSDADRSSVAIDCVGGDAECRFVYGDATDDDFYFVDCNASAVCASAVITRIDLTSTMDSLYKKAGLDCIDTSDCKFYYVGNATTDSYFGDCDNDSCTSGSVVKGSSGSRFGGAIQCLTTSNCKLAYYFGSGASTPSVRFGDCDTEDCLPTWTSQTAPWTSESTVTSVSLTYDSTNTDLIANIVKDATNQQAYYNTSDAASISWTGSTAYEFTAGAMDNISSPERVAGTSEMGVLVRLGSNLEFDPFACGSCGPTMDQVMRHGKWFSGGTEQPFTF